MQREGRTGRTVLTRDPFIDRSKWIFLAMHHDQMHTLLALDFPHFATM